MKVLLLIFGGAIIGALGGHLLQKTEISCIKPSLPTPDAAAKPTDEDLWRDFIAGKKFEKN